MRIFLYEFLNGGGLFSGLGGGRAPSSLVAEGAAMLRAVGSDLAAVPGVELVVLADGRFGGPLLPAAEIRRVCSDEEERRQFCDLAAVCDATLVIAPETAGHLLTRVRWVEAAGGRLLGPASELVELASDKHRMAEHLRAAGIPVPEGICVGPGEPLPADFAYPAVLKPCRGAGGCEVRRLTEARQASGSTVDEPRRLERFCPGTPASVALLCGPEVRFTLPPCLQRIEGADELRYGGGMLPLPPVLAMRATALARRVAGALPSPRGYLGVDLVLGPDPAGHEDVVIEVNARLTTSYVGLRAALEPGMNLAAAMLDVCGLRTGSACQAGSRVARLSFRPLEVEFGADGRVRLCGSGVS